MSRGKHEWEEGSNVVWDSSVIVGMTNDPSKKHYHYREYLKRGFVYHIEISEAEAIKGMVDLGMKPDAAIKGNRLAPCYLATCPAATRF